jgi:hypothetical protein
MEELIEQDNEIVNSLPAPTKLFYGLGMPINGTLFGLYANGRAGLS